MKTNQSKKMNKKIVGLCVCCGSPAAICIEHLDYLPMNHHHEHILGCECCVDHSKELIDRGITDINLNCLRKSMIQIVDGPFEGNPNNDGYFEVFHQIYLSNLKFEEDLDPSDGKGPLH